MQLQGLQLGIEPAPSGSLDQRSTNWATEALEFTEALELHFSQLVPIETYNVYLYHTRIYTLL